LIRRSTCPRSLAACRPASRPAHGETTRNCSRMIAETAETEPPAPSKHKPLLPCPPRPSGLASGGVWPRPSTATASAGCCQRPTRKRRSSTLTAQRAPWARSSGCASRGCVVAWRVAEHRSPACFRCFVLLGLDNPTSNSKHINQPPASCPSRMCRACCSSTRSPKWSGST
jgi:hypothetical protein